LGAALGYDPLDVVLRIAAGAYLRAKKAGMALLENAEIRSFGVVVVMEGGPRREVEEVHMSRRPQVQDIVNQSQCVFFGRDVIRVTNYCCVWVLCIYTVCEFGVWFRGGCGAGVYACCAVGLEHGGISYEFLSFLII
jgi:hypothetical protein